MTLAELGAQLREERVGFGLTVEDVAIRLKIPARILRAIEDGDVDDLPHTVYTRGFIKGYGLILGYSSDRITELLDSLEGFNQEDFSPPKTLEPKRGMDGQPVGEGHRGFGLVVKLLVIALLGAGGYAYYTHTYRDGILSSETAPPVTAAPALSAKTPPVASPEPSFSEQNKVTPHPFSSSSGTEGGSGNSTVTGGDSSLSGVSTPGSSVSTGLTGTEAGDPAGTLSSMAETSGGRIPSSEADPVSTHGFASLSAPSNTASGQATSTLSDHSVLPSTSGSSARQEAALPAGMHQIVLTADAECWVHANADGTDTRQFSLAAGETFAMPFKKSLVLKLGNAGGIKIKYDGQDMPAVGASGQVKTINFPPKPQG